MSTQKVSDAMIADMAASKLSGALPALDGSALTSLPDSVTKNASDPAINTNPSGGLGTLWLNTTSGELFMLTDATTNSNVWTNIGAGSGDVEPWQLGGTISGYTTCGEASAWHNEIDKFSFASNSNATDVGDLTVSRYATAPQSSTTQGFNSGGGGTGGRVNVIDKFNFSVDGNATDHGDLTVPRIAGSGQQV